MTIQDLIESAFRLLSVYAGGDQEIDPDDLNDALATLNDLLTNWNAQHLTIYTIVNRQFPLTAGIGSYTIGAGGNFGPPRPVKIESAGIIQTFYGKVVRVPLEIIDSRRWAQIPEKDLPALQPLKIYNDNNYPLAQLNLWPVPTGGTTPLLDLFVWDELTEPVALADTFDLPPAYSKAVRYNLAVDLIPEYGRGVNADTQIIMQIAQASKQELFALNASNAIAAEDPAPPAAVPAPAPRA